MTGRIFVDKRRAQRDKPRSNLMKPELAATSCDSQKDPEDEILEKGRQDARLVLDPVLNAGAFFHSHRAALGMPDPLSLLEELRRQVDQIWAGDLRRPEAMLLCQAQTLQTLFTMLTQRGMDADYLPKIQAYMSFALKAQAQCRSTVEEWLMARSNVVGVWLIEDNAHQIPEPRHDRAVRHETPRNRAGHPEHPPAGAPHSAAKRML
jgi:hypothetical protein